MNHENKKEEVVETKAEVKKDIYRYVCESCTGIAFYSDVLGVAPPVSHCKNCGKTIGTVKKENFILLSPDERTQFEARQ